ncbi:MAG TPA: alanine racemase [Caulobacteraceae bacterium]|jgi:D-serine deaminase-like pyridoxal phosphate-dependent protein
MKRSAPWRIRAAAVAARRIPGRKPKDRGAGGHDLYFTALSDALTAAGIAQPTFVIDRERLAANIAAVKSALAPTPLALRLAAKSLPAPALLRAVMDGTATERLMVFNSTMLDEIVGYAPAADVLLGRPLPAMAADAFLRVHGGAAMAAADPQWLIDTPRRLSQYLDIAHARDLSIRVSFEIDVGLHRGGLADASALAAMLDLALAAGPRIEIAGLMGYDAHAAGFANPAAEVARSMARYQGFVDALTAKTGKGPHEFVLDTAGSLTWRWHLADRTANEVTVGSAFVKPAHYDTAATAELAPAAFIAQPVLKALERPLIPGLEAVADDIEAADPNAARGFFLYGGYGDARPVSPPGLGWSRLWGGRGLLTGSRGVILEADDFVFLRPTESEGVATQFGDIAVFDGQAIVGSWPTFKIAA